MYSEDTIFQRTSLIAGDDMMAELHETSAIIFGVGGVGSWCAEALIRSGIGRLTIVDSDTVTASNINRQLPATTKTVGRVKVDVLRERLLDINPHADIQAVRGIYSPETAAEFKIEEYDYAIDAIDSLANKAHLILRCTSAPTAPRRAFYSSMGAALKLNAGAIDVAEFRKVTGCPLARALRNRFKKEGTMPRRKFRCVYSPERLVNRKDGDKPTEACESDTWTARKAAVNGTFAHTTAIFGFRLAGLVIEDLYERTAPKD
jgi:tRNA A37 threonylcarbamoyladenosine dehydratase